MCRRMRIWNGRAARSAIQPQRSRTDYLDGPDEAGPPADRIPARQGKASFLLAVEAIRRRGCAAAGVRLTGNALSGICRLDLYGAWRLLTVFEAPDRCVLLLVVEHTRSANPYRMLYAALGIDEPEDPRTKPTCCDAEEQPPIDPNVVERFERGVRDLGRVLATDARTPSRRHR
jgi:hypothetical protein